MRALVLLTELHRHGRADLRTRLGAPTRARRRTLRASLGASAGIAKARNGSAELPATEEITMTDQIKRKEEQPMIYRDFGEAIHVALDLSADGRDRIVHYRNDGAWLVSDGVLATDCTLCAPNGNGTRENPNTPNGEQTHGFAFVGRDGGEGRIKFSRQDGFGSFVCIDCKGILPNDAAVLARYL